MDLLGLMDVRVKGRAAQAPSAALLRPLDRADIAALGKEKGSKPSALKRIGERHHALARNLAMGMRPGEAALVCGMAPSRVSILQNDPAFKELMEFYREDRTAVERSLHERLLGLSLDAAEVLAERLEDEPDGLSTGQLMEVVKLGADRTGHGPSSTSTVNVNVNLASRLEAARKRIAERRTIDITPEKSDG